MADGLEYSISAFADIKSVDEAMRVIGDRLVARPLGVGLNALGALGGTTGPIGAGLGVAGAGLGALAQLADAVPVLGAVMSGLAQLPGILNDVLNTLTGFAALASPGQYYMFERAVLDVQGVIGQSFLPVLELMREGVRLFGDALANLLPSTGEVREALAPLRDAFLELGKAMRDLMADMGPAVRELVIEGIRDVAYVLTTLAKAAHEFLILVGPGLAIVRDMLGLPGPGEFRGSTGAAAAPASFASFMEYERQLQQAAYAQPGTQISDLPQTVLGIAMTLTNILGWCLAQNIDDLPVKIGVAVGNVIAGGKDMAHGAAVLGASKAGGPAAGGVVGVGLDVLSNQLGFGMPNRPNR